MKKGNNPEQILRYMALKEVCIVINASDVEEEMTTKDFLSDIEDHCYESDLLAPSLDHVECVELFDNDGNWLENLKCCPNCGAQSLHVSLSYLSIARGSVAVEIECPNGSCRKKWKAELLPGEFEVVK